MALVKMGGLVTQISGKIGGQTMGTGPAGAYIKNSGTPRKSITLLQRSKMSLMATTAQAWRSLSEPQRAFFQSASPDYPYLNRVGETKHYSGYAIFTALKNNLLNIGSAITPVPLPKYSFIPLVGVAITTPALSVQIKSSSGDDVAATYRLFITRPASIGITSPYKNFFFMSIVTAAEMGAGFNFRSQLLAKFGGYSAGMKFYYRVDGIQLTTGQVLKGMSSGSFTFA